MAINDLQFTDTVSGQRLKMIMEDGTQKFIPVPKPSQILSFGGSPNAAAVPNGADGLMTGADKAKLDSVALLKGNVALVAGTATVSNSAVKSTSVVLLTPKTAGGTIGTLTYTIIDSTSFTITSSSGADTSTISYVVF